MVFGVSSLYLSVRHEDHASVSPSSAHMSEANPGIPSRPLYHCATWFEPSCKVIRPQAKTGRKY